MPNEKFHKTLRRTTLWPMAAMLVLGLLLVGLIQFLLNSAGWVEHTDRIIAQSHIVEGKLVDMETGLRGYQITGDRIFLEPYQQASRAIAAELQTLGALVADNAAQSDAVRGLRTTVDQWRGFAAETLARRSAGAGFAETPFNARGKQLMDAVRVRLASIADAEQPLRLARAHSLRWIRRGLLGSLLLALLVAGPASAFLLRRFIRRTTLAFQRTTEEAQRQAEELRVTLRSIGDAVIATDAEGRVTFLNPMAEQLTGWRTSEASGKMLKEIFPIFNEQTGKPAENPVARVLQEEKVIGLANHTILRARDGREIPIDDSAAPIRGEAGEVRGVILVFHDVSESRQAQRLIRESEERYRVLFSTVPVAVFVCDRDAVIQNYNERAVELWGRTPEIGVERHCGSTKLILPDGALLPHAQSPMMEVLRTGVPARNVEVFIERPDGSRVPVVVNFAALKNAEGEIVGAVTSFDDISDRKKAEEALAETQARLEATLNASEIATWTWDIQADRVVADRNLAHFFSVAPEDAAGGPIEHYTRAIYPEDRARVEAVIAEAMQSESGGYEVDYRLLQPDGAVRWVGARGKMERDALGKPVRFPGVVIDITARKRAEFAQAEQKRVLGLIAEDAPLSQTLDAVARMVEGQASTGILASILLLDNDGLHLRHGAGPNLPAAYNEAIDGIEIGPSAGSCGTAAFLKKSIRATDIATDPLWENFAELALGHGLRACWSTPIFSSRDQLLGTFALYYPEAREPGAEDERLVELATRTAAIAIERKQTERTLRESAERFRFLAESMPQKIFTARASGEVNYFNGQWTEFTGLSFEQIRDWGWLQFIHPDDVEGNVRCWKHSIETGEYFEFEHRFRRHDGAYRWHLSRAHAMRDGDGNVVMWIGSNTDIEDVRQAQEKAERASRAKDDFLAALSHELRTPLTPVLMTAAILRNEERLPQDVREQLAMMHRNIELEARLIDDLLDLSRISHGKLRLRVQSCDAHSLLASALEIVRDDATDKRLTMEVDLTAERSQLSGDPARLQQVFWNLLKNAIKFTPEGGRLTVRSRDLEDRIVCEISDTGIGIASEALERIFLPFEQAGPFADHRFGGLGLGLAISKAILELHGGEVRAASGGPGQGATFAVELPAAEPLLGAAEAAPLSNGRAESAMEIAPLRVLLVEDHRPTLEVLARLLSRDGHNVTTATSVADAFAAADGKTFDVVISDLGLPDGTGFELVEKLRAIRPLRAIALSGYGMDEDIRRSQQAGFATHLIKPVDFAQLQQALLEVMT